MKSLRIGIVWGCLALSSVLFAQSGLSPEAQLKAAMNRETVDRDFAGAMEQYKQIAATFAANHAVASKALLQLGGIYERLGKPEARTTYEQIVTKYPDAGAAYVAARARLTAIQEAAAGPFKVKTLDTWLKDAENISGSPDGKYLSYVRPADDRRRLYLREIGSGQERMLAELGTGWVGSLQWSPDSQRIALGVITDGAIDRRVVTIATRDVRGLGTSTIQLGYYFKWSPDGRRVAVVNHVDKGPYELHVFTMGNTDDMVLGLTPGPDGAPGFPGVVWSPDSSRIAFTLEPAEGNVERIQVMTVATKAPTVVPVPKTTGTGRMTLRSWTANNDIEFVQTLAGGNDIFLVSAAGGAPRKVCEGRGASGGDGCQTLSPDGSMVITRKNISGGGRIVFRSTATGTERPLTPEAVWEQTAIGFSPDSKLFAFRSNRDGAYALYVAPVDRMPVSSPVRVAVLDSEGSGVGGWWTPTGLVVRITNNQTNQYRVDLDPRTGKPTGAPIRLTQDSPVNIRARISPDGQRIAYISRGRPTGIALMDANGARERVIKEVPPDMLLRMNILDWLSDSELLISDAKLGTGPLADAPKHLMRMNVATGEMREAGPVVEGRSPSLAAGANVLYVNNKDEFFIRPIAGGTVRPIKIDGWWDFSVSTQWLAYATVDESVAKGKPMPGDLRVRSIDTAVERVVVKFADTFGGSQSALDVSRDGRFLLYQDPVGKIMMANVETGESWLVPKTPPAGVDFDWADGRLSPDGTYVILDGDISKSTWRAYDGVTHDAVTKLIGQKKQ
jgi:Tol biopolymer transport system component